MFLTPCRVYSLLTWLVNRINCRVCCCCFLSYFHFFFKPSYINVSSLFNTLVILITFYNNICYIRNLFRWKPVIRQNPIAVSSDCSGYFWLLVNFGLLVNIWFTITQKLIHGRSSMKICPGWDRFLSIFNGSQIFLIFLKFRNTGGHLDSFLSEWLLNSLNTSERGKIQLLNSINFSKSTFIYVWLWFCVHEYTWMCVTVKVMVDNWFGPGQEQRGSIYYHSTLVVRKWLANRMGAVSQWWIFCAKCSFVWQTDVWMQRTRGM